MVSDAVVGNTNHQCSALQAWNKIITIQQQKYELVFVLKQAMKNSNDTMLLIN